MNLGQLRLRASRRALGLVIFAGAVGLVGAKPYAPGISYRVRISIGMPQMPGMPMGDLLIVGHGLSLGSRNRLDIDTASPVGPQVPITPGDYILSLDSGRVVAVNPLTKTYVDGFNMASGGLPPELMAQASITDVSVTTEKLGAGEAIDGRATEKYKMIAKYTINIMGMAITMSNESEILTTQLPAAITTPFSGGLPKNMSTGPFADFYAKMLDAQKQISGTAIKSTTTTNVAGPMTMSLTQTMQVTDIKTVEIDEKAFEIPAGYTARPPL